MPSFSSEEPSSQIFYQTLTIPDPSNGQEPTKKESTFYQTPLLRYDIPVLASARLLSSVWVTNDVTNNTKTVHRVCVDTYPTTSTLDGDLCEKTRDVLDYSARLWEHAQDMLASQGDDTDDQLKLLAIHVITRSTPFNHRNGHHMKRRDEIEKLTGISFDTGLHEMKSGTIVTNPEDKEHKALKAASTGRRTEAPSTSTL
ncbi:hypothetical protein I302_106170 [Kwoniella bestiolae CBS 10118]|uniref:Uncharacterized protein n=1 Tax=Kwoniella bestiolae CBS 10118 TaxID=1296100 RepID=A0A1B9G365_9TREE|nr:hypothetical protein I302_05293 [Kwoniella bestiolae CBS 10118]OCF25473.1 hypothetical protein I302_05293 [Kwoniella bestiolae CBS 10118]